jgi:hypothetical protein
MLLKGRRACKRQLRNQDARSLAVQVRNVQTRIVEEAGQAPGSGFKVVEETRQCGLTATSCRQQRQHEVADGIALMAVCVVKDQIDILKEATLCANMDETTTLV